MSIHNDPRHYGVPPSQYGDKTVCEITLQRIKAKKYRPQPISPFGLVMLALLALFVAAAVGKFTIYYLDHQADCARGAVHTFIQCGGN